MAKRRTGRKSQAMRDLLTSSPELRNSEIVAALATKRIKVTPALVSNLRSRVKAGGGNGKLGRPQALKDQISLAALVEAKRLADQLGGVERAAQVMRALAALSG